MKFYIFILIFTALNVSAKKIDFIIEVEVLLDGKYPISGGYINIVNQIPKVLSMPGVENLGVRVLDKNGMAFIKLENLNDKGLLNVTILSDRCDWHSDFIDIQLSEVTKEPIKVQLNPTSKKC